MSFYDDEEREEREAAKRKHFLENEAFKLELGKTYLQESDTWAKFHFKIIFVDEKIAVGIKVYCGIYESSTRNCASYEMFKVETGERYGDSRLAYRLKKELDTLR